ncbi:MAG: tagatose-bisphosphate aldolase, partial [Candidatus Pacebacteria bacterium CG10_big_fil_rev_8_21_14_0_10_45_6]
QVARFVEETGIDLLAPAVGNVHGMLKHSPNPHLFVKKIKEFRKAANVPLVLHGGSGIPDEDFVQAIDAGVRIIHISTELRRAWRSGLEKGLAEHPAEVAPYKLMESALAEIKAVALARLRLFNKL